MLELDLNQDEIPYGTNIKIIGVGGAGSNAIDTMIEYDLQGVEFIAANTNIQDLKSSKAKFKLQLGKEVTKGLGAGANPDVGRKAAEESREDIKRVIKDADLLFIAAGMGGGTGTGATPIIAQMAREMGILTIGIVNRPFIHEGKKRTVNAEKGIQKLHEHVDTLIVVPNEKMKEILPNMTVLEAFKKADSILYEAAKAIADIIHFSGHISVDYADVKTVMSNRGKALMGAGVGDGDNRAVDATQEALNNPLLSDISIEHAKGVLINITAGDDFKIDELGMIVSEVVKRTGDEGDMINGLVVDEKMQGKVKVTVIAAGLEGGSTSIYERESIIQEKTEEGEDIGHTLQRIRTADTLNLDKEKEDESKEFPGKQMEIPAFLRKFSN
ncbi:MAG: cell division protein FtsZ [Candidatus Cloacimonetes bacterium]|nr:cell division protein FtsZ [Candidatus Cloacimonadota bacterium]MCF7814128.1 cell division protein FtsZ [Candidatus Cloacimonadota bacterium]MCF7868723.1 cell division protein FtsZ [Candidatus Cloacimonadota bacterium]MCF7884127.1 cell division protein FtsZ [Candidatus Cloacimonadota bacterium]